MRLIADFTVDGVAEPKGSMTPVLRGDKILMLHRVNNQRKDGTRSDGRERYQAWTLAVSSAARVWQLTHRRKIDDTEPLRVEIEFFLPKPASASKRILFPVRKPDSDKLARCVLDALTTGGLIADDARIVDLIVSKRFATEKPHARIIVSSLWEQDV